MRLEAAVEGVRRELEIEPEVAEATTMPELPEGATAPARARDLERELKLMGPINPLALEEFTALQERHTFLEEQLEDVRTTRRELTRVIKAVDNEIKIVDSFGFDAPKTARFASILAALGIDRTCLLALTGDDQTTLLSARNIADIQTTRIDQLNAYDLLSTRFLLVERGAFERWLTQPAGAEQEEAA